MVIFEALQALQGDCLLLTLPRRSGGTLRWLIDGGPGSGPRAGWKGGPAQPRVVPWRDVLAAHLGHRKGGPAIEIDLAVCTHVDDDHIEGLRQLLRKALQATPAEPEPIRFARFWFNSLSAILAGKSDPAATSAIGKTVTSAMLSVGAFAGGAALGAQEVLDRRSPQAVIQSIGQGIDLESDLKTLRLDGNPPFRGPVRSGARSAGGSMSLDLDGVLVTVLGPRASRLETLRKEWAKALAEKDAKTRAAMVADYFLPTSDLDDAYPNLSSIVLLIEVEGRRLLLTGDALGDDVVASWRDDLGHGAEPCRVDVLKLPHHGSERNVSKTFLETFPAEHYVFSANGKYENPDAATIEAVVATAAGRPITLHFTNGDVVWSAPYSLKGPDPAPGPRATVTDLPGLRDALWAAYGKTFESRERVDPASSVRIDLPPKGTPA